MSNVNETVLEMKEKYRNVFTQAWNEKRIGSGTAGAVSEGQAVGGSICTQLRALCQVLSSPRVTQDNYNQLVIHHPIKHIHDLDGMHTVDSFPQATGLLTSL